MRVSLILLIFTVAVAACDVSSVAMDGGADTGADTGVRDADASADRGVTDADAGTSAVPMVVALSATGHDRLYALTHDSNGNILAAGQVASGAATDADFAFLLTRFLPNGSLDTSFGTNGVATQNVVVAGNKEGARGVVVQSSGRIVIAGTVDSTPTAMAPLDQDTDIVLVGFTAAGTLDTTFGTNGVVRLDLGTGVATGSPATLAGADAFGDIQVASDNKLLLHVAARTQEQSAGMRRADTDNCVLRLSADGALDTTYSDDGIVCFDLGMASTAARGLYLASDGSVIGSGYATTTALGQSTKQPIVFKLLSSGAFDTAFASQDATSLPGVWYDFAVQREAEAYGVYLSGTSFVTIGYGASPDASATGTDWVSFRFATNGVQDTTYGSGGAGYIDAGRQADNARAAVVLPDGRLLGVGAGRAMGVARQDAMLGMYLGNGMPDTTFAAHANRLYRVGPASSFLWDVALDAARGTLAIVGIAGGVAPTTADGGVDGGGSDASVDAGVAADADDDSVLFLVPVSQL